MVWDETLTAWVRQQSGKVDTNYNSSVETVALQPPCTQHANLRCKIHEVHVIELTSILLSFEHNCTSSHFIYFMYMAVLIS